ncbi:hypothetical protein PIB30_043600 [Stylosanthes scabra]|uniref:Uncharacterized protein n=1 Tax=Stylosanthes scabra TaxID=79078 RepID=A0ABU6TF77_9FABA|nr:hypothetical protein [Stylosanthes scabra]
MATEISLVEEAIKRSTEEWTTKISATAAATMSTTAGGRIDSKASKELANSPVPPLKCHFAHPSGDMAISLMPAAKWRSCLVMLFAGPFRRRLGRVGEKRHFAYAYGELVVR